jgi:hypothetical protein
LDAEAAMPLSPLIVVIGVAFLVSVGLLLVLALEDKFDEKTASEFEQDVAYTTMLMELRNMSGRGVRGRRRSGPGDVTPLYESSV